MLRMDAIGSVMASVDRWFEKLMGKPEGAGLVPAKRRCRWCRRGNAWDKRWEYVNGRRWYHKVCVDLMDMIA